MKMNIPTEVAQELLGKIISEGNFSPVEIAKEAGISQKTIYDIINGVYKKVQRATVRRICEAFGYTLVYGVDTYNITRMIQKGLSSKGFPHLAEDTRPGNSFYLPPGDENMPPVTILTLGQAGMENVVPEKVNQFLSQSTKAIKARKNWERDVEKWITNPVNVKDITTYGLIVEGDSMLPLLRPGTIVIANTVKKYVTGDLAVVKVKDSSPFIKQIFLVDGGIVQLKSFNPAYQDRIIQTDQLEFCHKIVWIRMGG